MSYDRLVTSHIQPKRCSDMDLYFSVEMRDFSFFLHILELLLKLNMRLNTILDLHL